MRRTLIVRAEAEADLAASQLWYEEQHEGLGARFIAEVDATLRQIQASPLAFTLVCGKFRRALLSACSTPLLTSTSSWSRSSARPEIRACGENAWGLPANNRWRGP